MSYNADLGTHYTLLSKHSTISEESRVDKKGCLPGLEGRNCRENLLTQSDIL